MLDYEAIQLSSRGSSIASSSQDPVCWGGPFEICLLAVLSTACGDWHVGISKDDKVMHHGRFLQNRPLGAKTLHNCVLHVAFLLGTWQDCTINAFQEVGGIGIGTCGMDCCCCLSRMDWIGRQASVSSPLGLMAFVRRCLLVTASGVERCTSFVHGWTVCDTDPWTLPSHGRELTTLSTVVHRTQSSTYVQYQPRCTAF